MRKLRKKPRASQCSGPLAGFADSDKQDEFEGAYQGSGGDLSGFSLFGSAPEGRLLRSKLGGGLPAAAIHGWG